MAKFRRVRTVRRRTRSISIISGQDDITANQVDCGAGLRLYPDDTELIAHTFVKLKIMVRMLLPVQRGSSAIMLSVRGSSAQGLKPFGAEH